MTRQFTEPKISPASLDMRKHWYVWFRFFDVTKNAFVQLRYKGDINTIGVYKERIAEANALKQSLIDGLKAGWNPLLKDQPVKIYSISEAFTYILKIKSATLRKKSKYAYTYITGLFLKWLDKNHLTQTSTRHFTGSQAQAYMDWLLITKGYSGRTFNDHLIVLRTFFNCFIERDWIVKNVFRTVKRKTQTVGRNLAYTDAEKLLLDKTLYEKDRRLYYFTQIMFHCFIRRSELVSLKVKHIDLVNKTIIIPGENAKNNHQESVVIPQGLEPVLKEMELNKYPSECFVFGRRLLTGPAQYKNPNWISTRLSLIVKDLGFPPGRGLYSIKHTGVCAYYYATGKDLYSLLRQLRHRDLATTQTYLKSLGLIENNAFRNAKVA